MPTLELSRGINKMGCMVPGCVKEENGPRRRLFKMPKRSSQLLDWCHNFQLDPSSISIEKSVVCDRHFESHCLNVHKQLRRGARPTLHLGHTADVEILQNPSNWARCTEVPETPADVCCVPNCGRYKDAEEEDTDMQLFSFPKVRTLAEKWLRNIRLEANKEQLAELKVCNAHFEIYCLENGRPQLGAMPTLQLGHDDHHDIHRSSCLTSLSASKMKRYCNRNGYSYDCCFPQCVELQKSYLRISYNLPQSQAMRDAWIAYMELEEPKEQEKEQQLKLCPLHLIILYEHSVDNFPEHTTEELLEDNYAAARNSVRIRIISCAVRGCKTLKTRDGGCLHGLPQRRDILQMWLHNMQLVFYEQQRYMYKICSKHFEPNCFTDTTHRLKPWSMPTLELPVPEPGEPEVYQNPTEAEWQQMNEQWAAEQLQTAQPMMEDEEHEEVVQVKLEPETEMEADNLMAYEEEDYSQPPVDGEEDASSQQPLEMQPLEVLLEVGHVEKCRTYEQMDTKANLSYAEQQAGPLPSNGFFASNGNKYTARNCSVQGCHVTLNDICGNVKLHKFPTSWEAMQKWMHNTQVKVCRSVSWRFRICSYHFMEDCFQGARLRRGAMPTLQLGPKRPSHIYESEFNVGDGDEEQPIEESSKQTPKARVVGGDNISLCLPSPGPPRKSSKFCQVDGCPNHLTSENLTLHKFPHSPDMCAKWQHNTQVPFDPVFRWRYRICSAHFEPICLLNMRLLHGSVPTLHLGPRAPQQLFDSDFEAISMRLDKQKSSSEQQLYIKQEQEEDHDDAEQDEDEFSFLVPEMQLHEDAGEHEANIKTEPSQTYNGRWKDLSLPSIKQEDTPTMTCYNPVKSGYDKCSLVHCQRQRSVHGVHIYKFPRSHQLQQHWMHNLRIRYDERRPWKTMICSVHFEAQCIRLRKLRPWAVPTLELGDNVPQEIFSNEQSRQQFENDEMDVDFDLDLKQPMLEEDYGDDDDVDNDDNDADGDTEDGNALVRQPLWKKRKLNHNQLVKIKTCSLPYCRSPRGDGIKLFRLPNRLSDIHKWEVATGMHFTESQRNTKLICSRHFDPQLIGVRRLMYNAVPTLHLRPETAREERMPRRPCPVGPRCFMPSCPQDLQQKLHKFPSGK